MEKPRLPMEALEFFKEQGRKGGRIGGRRRKETTTKAQRQEWGRKGGLASGKARAKARKKEQR
jgi:general stress protein YciG